MRSRPGQKSFGWPEARRTTLTEASPPTVRSAEERSVTSSSLIALPRGPARRMVPMPSLISTWTVLMSAFARGSDEVGGHGHDVETAVHVEDLAGDAARHVREQEEAGVADF